MLYDIHSYVFKMYIIFIQNQLHEELEASKNNLAEVNKTFEDWSRLVHVFVRTYFGIAFT